MDLRKKTGLSGLLCQPGLVDQVTGQASPGLTGPLYQQGLVDQETGPAVPGPGHPPHPTGLVGLETGPGNPLHPAGLGGLKTGLDHQEDIHRARYCSCTLFRCSSEPGNITQTVGGDSLWSRPIDLFGPVGNI